MNQDNPTPKSDDAGQAYLARFAQAEQHLHNVCASAAKLVMTLADMTSDTDREVFAGGALGHHAPFFTDLAGDIARDDRGLSDQQIAERVATMFLVLLVVTTNEPKIAARAEEMYRVFPQSGTSGGEA